MNNDPSETRLAQVRRDEAREVVSAAHEAGRASFAAHGTTAVVPEEYGDDDQARADFTRGWREAWDAAQALKRTATVHRGGYFVCPLCNASWSTVCSWCYCVGSVVTLNGASVWVTATLDPIPPEATAWLSSFAAQETGRRRVVETAATLTAARAAFKARMDEPGGLGTNDVLVPLREAEDAYEAALRALPDEDLAWCLLGNLRIVANATYYVERARALGNEG